MEGYTKQEILKMYPVLNKNIRLIKLPECTWFDDVDNDLSESITPLDAFLLANCNGEITTEDLIYIAKSTFDFSGEDAYDRVDNLFRNYNKSIGLVKNITKRTNSFSPKDFIYICEETDSLRLSSPIEMTLSITHKCNFRCIYCFNASDETLIDELSTEEWIDVIKQAAELGVVRCIITGGEPMMHSGILKILNELQSHNIVTVLCTNGSFLTEENIFKLKESKVNRIQISLDTIDKELNKVMTRADDLENILNGIGLLIKYGAMIQIKSVLTSMNLYSIPVMLQKCHNLGVKKVVLERFDVSGIGRGNSKLFVNDLQIGDLQDSIKKNNYEGMEILMATRTQKWKDKLDIIACGAFQRSINIMANGDINACEKLANVSEMTIGNVKEETLLELWNSPKINSIIQPDDSLICEICRKCENLNECRTGCYAIKFFLKQDFYKPDPRCPFADAENNPYKNL